MVGDRPEGPTDPIQLRGRTAPWGVGGLVAIAALVVVALWLRLPGLGVEGFADDEVHKWLAAQRYLTGDFGGDDVEHPMLMKSLVALAIAAAFMGTAGVVLWIAPALIVRQGAAGREQELASLPAGETYQAAFCKLKFVGAKPLAEADTSGARL